MRGAVFLPMVFRTDLSVSQDVFKNIAGRRNSLQFRVDIANFGNLLNSDWGVGQRLVNAQPLDQSRPADASGRAPVPAAGRQQRVDDASPSKRRLGSATFTA